MPQCEALAGAKFGFHVEGDTLGANRVMDLLLSDIVPLFTDPRQYDILPFQDQIPWKLLSDEISMEKGEDDFIRHLGQVVENKGAFDEKLRLIRKVKKLAAWSKGNDSPFELYMSTFYHLLRPSLTTDETTSAYQGTSEVSG